MTQYKRLIFVCMDNSCQSPIAEAIMKKINRVPELEICSRGLIVLFPEPYNPKVRSVLLNNDIIMENGLSAQLMENDFSDTTLILTMNREEKNKVIEDYENHQNVYTIMEFAGGSGDILDPYGSEMEVYTLFFESIYGWVKQIEEIIYNEAGESASDTIQEEEEL